MPLASTPRSPVTRRLGTLTGGLVLVAIGVAVTIRAEVGVAPYDVLTTGLVDLTDIPTGIAAMLLPLAFVAVGVIGPTLDAAGFDEARAAQASDCAAPGA